MERCHQHSLSPIKVLVLPDGCEDTPLCDSHGLPENGSKETSEIFVDSFEGAPQRNGSISCNEGGASQRDDLFEKGTSDLVKEQATEITETTEMLDQSKNLPTEPATDPLDTEEDELWQSLVKPLIISKRK